MPYSLIFSLAIFVGSIAAIIVMVGLKRPALRNLSLKKEAQQKMEEAGLVSGGAFSLLRDHLGIRGLWQSGSMVALEKTLRRVRLWALRLEHRISAGLEGLRRRKEDVVIKEEVNEDEHTYLPPDIRRRERELIERIAENPRGVTNFKELGFLYLNNGLEVYARETFEMAVRLGSKDRQIKKALERLEGEAPGE